MEIFLERLLKREEAIRNWLKKNELESFLIKSDQILNSLPRKDIKEEFRTSIKKALEHCAENEAIKALDFEWYYSGSEIGGAYAYGLDNCESEGELSKTDLGPNELSEIEIDIEHGSLEDEEFEELPVYTAINAMVEKINPLLEQSTELGNLLGDTETLITDYFQIWNYKIGYEVCEELKDNNAVQKLKDRAPFWVTMTRHERWSVPIMLID